jgi:hypothetical protein
MRLRSSPLHSERFLFVPTKASDSRSPSVKERQQTKYNKTAVYCFVTVCCSDRSQSTSGADSSQEYFFRQPLIPLTINNTECSGSPIRARSYSILLLGTLRVLFPNEALIPGPDAFFKLSLCDCESQAPMLPRAAALKSRTRSVDLTGRRTTTHAWPSVPSSPTSRAHVVSLLKALSLLFMMRSL